jgi:hypothetical protein
MLSHIEITKLDRRREKHNKGMQNPKNLFRDRVIDFYLLLIQKTPGRHHQPPSQAFANSRQLPIKVYFSLSKSKISNIFYLLEFTDQS